MLLSHLKFFRWKVFVDLCTPFLIGLFAFLGSNYLSSLNILDISPLSDEVLVKIFSQFVGCGFVPLTVFFALQQLCNLWRPICLYLILKKILILLLCFMFVCLFLTTRNPSAISPELDLSWHFTMYRLPKTKLDITFRKYIWLFRWLQHILAT